MKHLTRSVGAFLKKRRIAWLGLVPVLVTSLLWGRVARVDETYRLEWPCRWETGVVASDKGFLPVCEGFLSESVTASGLLPVPNVLRGSRDYMRKYVGLVPGKEWVYHQPNGDGSVTPRLPVPYIANGLYQGHNMDVLCPPGNEVSAFCDLRYQDRTGKVVGEGITPISGSGNSSGRYETETRNHLTSGNNSCGKANQVTVTMEGTEVKVTVNMGTPYGAREAAYVNGAFIQALKCHSATVFDDLVNKGSHRIVLKDPTAIKMAKDLDAKIADLRTQYVGFAGEAKNVLQCEWNKIEQYQEVTSANSSDNWKLHFCAIQLQITALVQQMVVYEIFARTQKGYYSSFLQNGALSSALETFGQSVGKSCEVECEKSKDAAEGTACAQKCYEKALVPFLQGEFDKRWPIKATGPEVTGEDFWPSKADSSGECL